MKPSWPTVRGPKPLPACEALGEGVSKPRVRVEPGTSDFCQNRLTSRDSKSPRLCRKEASHVSAMAATSWMVPNRPAWPLTPPMA